MGDDEEPAPPAPPPPPPAPRPRERSAAGGLPGADGEDEEALPPEDAPRPRPLGGPAPPLPLPEGAPGALREVFGFFVEVEFFFCDRATEKRNLLYALSASLSLSLCAILAHEDIGTSHLEVTPGMDPSPPASAVKNRDENKDDDDEGVDVESQQPPTSMPLAPLPMPALLLLLPWARRRIRGSVRRMVLVARSS